MCETDQWINATRRRSQCYNPLIRVLTMLESFRGGYPPVAHLVVVAVLILHGFWGDLLRQRLDRGLTTSSIDLTAEHLSRHDGPFTQQCSAIDRLYILLHSR